MIPARNIVQLSFKRSVNLWLWCSISCDYAPNFEEVDWAYWFLVVQVSIHSSKTVHARVLKLHIWISHGKIVDARFFSCQSNLPFWSYAPLNKIRMKSDACHILWTVHARVLKFHIWILMEKKLAHMYFLVHLPPFLSYAPLKNSEWNLASKISQKAFFS